MCNIHTHFNLSNEFSTVVTTLLRKFPWQILRQNSLIYDKIATKKFC